MEYEVRTTAEFDQWLGALRDSLARKSIAARLIRIGQGNFGDHASVGEGVSELRIHVGPGYRAYYAIRGGVVVIMLCGGDKGSQARDIARAKEIAASLE